MQPDEAFPVLLREVGKQMLLCDERRTFVTRSFHQQENQAAAFVVWNRLELKARPLLRTASSITVTPGAD